MSKRRFTNRYDDIINLPHPVSPTHPQMPNSDRAAQFLPFSALTGYDAQIREAQRLTQERMDLDEDQKAVLDERMAELLENLAEQPHVTLTVFCPDEKKAGGSYQLVKGNVKKADLYEGVLIFTDGTRVQIGDVMEIEMEGE